MQYIIQCRQFTPEPTSKILNHTHGHDICNSKLYLLALKHNKPRTRKRNEIVWGLGRQYRGWLFGVWGCSIVAVEVPREHTPMVALPPCMKGLTHRIHSSSSLGNTFRILNINHKKELSWSLRVKQQSRGAVNAVAGNR